MSRPYFIVSTRKVQLGTWWKFESLDHVCARARSQSETSMKTEDQIGTPYFTKKYKAKWCWRRPCRTLQTIPAWQIVMKHSQQSPSFCYAFFPPAITISKRGVEVSRKLPACLLKHWPNLSPTESGMYAADTKRRSVCWFESASWIIVSPGTTSSMTSTKEKQLRSPCTVLTLW